MKVFRIDGRMVVAETIDMALAIWRRWSWADFFEMGNTLHSSHCTRRALAMLEAGDSPSEPTKVEMLEPYPMYAEGVDRFVEDVKVSLEAMLALQVKEECK